MDTIMFISAVLTVLVIIVNGWTDAPNAISTVVASGCLSYRKAVFMAGICNFIGLTTMAYFSPKVLENMMDLLYICGEENIWICTIASFSAIIIFGIFAWCFGIPTSESHGLIAAIIGCAVALGRLNNKNISILYPALYGLLVSVVLGFCGGYLVSKIVNKFVKKNHKNIMKIGQIVSSAGLSFMHGAQDGLKFTGLMIAVDCAYKGQTSQGISGKYVFLCSFIMMMGTFMGGKRIIENLTQNLVTIDLPTGFSTDIGSIIALYICSIYGMPVSTTHTKTSAMLGGVYAVGKCINMKTVLGIIFAWVITFPICFLIAFSIIQLTIT